MSLRHHDEIVNGAQPSARYMRSFSNREVAISQHVRVEGESM
jgi:hypothetical protein